MAVDLFAGCGGLTMGLKAAGFEVAAAVENNPAAVQAYQANHADVPFMWARDICELNGDQLLGELGLRRGELALLAGSPPCQGFSRLLTLNRINAIDDPRNALVDQFLRLVDELLPMALLLENVPGLGRDPRYQRFLRRIHELGYTYTDSVHDAADYGVPQRRQRLILMAVRGARVELPPRVGVAERGTVRAAIGHLPPAGKSGDPAHDVSEKRATHVAEFIRRIPEDGGSRRDLGAEAQLQCHVDCDGFYDVYGRMRWNDVSPTITSGFVNPSKGRFLHPVEHRCITPREGAILQTFPESYVFPMRLGKYPIATMIGNAFPPLLAKLHAEAIRYTLRNFR
ncbi:MAG: DNA cytosine methyltransferase [Deltaproteobacteria bacterium]|nr:DNA cytosine methyltransferase [Deltaproteobacteria bacterium]